MDSGRAKLDSSEGGSPPCASRRAWAKGGQRVDGRQWRARRFAACRLDTSMRVVVSSLTAEAAAVQPAGLGVVGGSSVSRRLFVRLGNDSSDRSRRRDQLPNLRG
jgi:hypothetical protein